MISLVSLIKQVKVKTLGDSISGSSKPVGETQADEHANFI